LPAWALSSWRAVRVSLIADVTVGKAIWPDLLSAEDRARLDPGVPPNLDRAPDVLVVGGGILGLATAAICTQAGLGSVVVLERDGLGSGASGGAAGLLAPEAHVGVDPPALVHLARLSLQAWRDLHRSWPGGVGLCDVDWLGLQPVTEQFASEQPLGAEQLDEETIAKLLPGLSGATRGVLVQRQGRVNPLEAIARLAAALPGAATGVAVRGVQRHNSRIAMVETTIGDFRPRNVVFATGTPPQVHGLELSVSWGEVKGHMVVSEPTEHRLPGVVAPIATIIADGRLMRGGTIDTGDAERVVRPEVIAGLWGELEADWPVVRGIRLGYQWACFRPAHPDLMPVIDQLPGMANAWLTSGHYKTGILMAPGTARAIVSWIASGERPSEVANFGLARFAQAR
jgi:glycine oxidase